MRKRLALRMLSTGFFALPVLVLGLTFFALSSKVEARSCTPCDPTELNCDGSTCVCEWTFGGYHCNPE